METLRILLADDHSLFRKGLKALLAVRKDFQVVGEAGNGQAAIELARQTQPDIVLMDIDMPGLNGLTATRVIRREIPQTKVVILTVADYESQLFEAIKCGASGYLLKNLEPEQLFDMLDKIRQGEAAINGILAAKILDEFSRQMQHDGPQKENEKLTEREIEVLERLVRGDDNKEIAEALSITPNTVKTHLSNIMEKLHLRNRIEAAVYAITEGLVDYPPRNKHQ